MTRRTETIDAGWFDALYRAEGDPWGFRSSDYEREKYGRTLAALRQPRYSAALEIGCAIGVLTARLAARCDALLAVDGSATALEAARVECATRANVTFAQGMVPKDFPAGRYDLIVLSEVLYYLNPADLAALAGQCCAALRPQGEMVLCHWLGDTDYPLAGAEASDLFAAEAATRSLRREPVFEGAYRLERLTAP